MAKLLNALKNMEVTLDEWKGNENIAKEAEMYKKQVEQLNKQVDAYKKQQQENFERYQKKLKQSDAADKQALAARFNDMTPEEQAAAKAAGIVDPNAKKKEATAGFSIKA